jgi:lipoxygenase homology domain-containing protein 1
VRQVNRLDRVVALPVATTYHVSVKTGTVRYAGTDANVFVKIFGTKGDTGKLKLASAENTKNKFEAGRTDDFRLEATDIGQVRFRGRLDR